MSKEAWKLLTSSECWPFSFPTPLCLFFLLLHTWIFPVWIQLLVNKFLTHISLIFWLKRWAAHSLSGEDFPPAQKLIFHTVEQASLTKKTQTVFLPFNNDCVFVRFTSFMALSKSCLCGALGGMQRWPQSLSEVMNTPTALCSSLVRLSLWSCSISYRYNDNFGPCWVRKNDQREKKRKDTD